MVAEKDCGRKTQGRKSLMDNLWDKRVYISFLCSITNLGSYQVYLNNSSRADHRLGDFGCIVERGSNHVAMYRIWDL